MEIKKRVIEAAVCLMLVVVILCGSSVNAKDVNSNNVAVEAIK